jgi:tRNA A-37 threonylcarbamoyl transferase component Bud32
LGEGAKKRVYLARDTQLDREVALALFKTENLDEAGRARIRREAQALSQLGDHPHIVTLYDVNEEDGQPYFISHYLPGGSLHEMLQRLEHHRLPLARAFTLADEICQALQHAHAHGIVHRDLKPSNVWLTQEGTAKLGDFGLATLLDHSRFTLEGVFIGTAAYLPPEHLQGKKLDARSDLYSLGAMLYEMVAGRPPFVGDSLVSLIAQHLNATPVAPSQYNPGIPPALDALLLQLLAKTPDERLRSAAEVRTTLQALATATVAGNIQPAAPPLHALDRLASDVFVGRERESDTLRDDLEEALAGRGRVVVLTGEPGIGKTRLATELTIYAQLRGARLLTGRCHEDEGAPPYWPWVQMFRAHAAECAAEQLRSEMGPGAADIAQLIPDLPQHFPTLPTPPRLDPKQARFRLFDSLTTFLKNAATCQPLVVFLDDLQWADPSSLLFLQFLGREISEARLLMLITCRDGDAARRSLLAQTLAAIARTVGSKTLPLRSLSVTDVARFMELTTGQPPSSELVTLVHRETEGHPFFMTEIVRLLATEESSSALDTQHSTLPRLPQSVRAVIARGWSMCLENATSY